ncbi:fibronectin type III-like domain-contianing protein, partial [Paraburkholderia sp. BR14262]|uniref:fibronectin type III-like domain-contianing protein n=1 Tax=Paraburkholderia sp. BR14262 TaxID=3236999 RepID=UPI0034CF604E
VELSFTVENTGSRVGTEIVQIYVRDQHASTARPVRELKAFARVPLAAGALTRVNVKLPVDMFNFTDARGERIVEPGKFDLMVGSSSRDIHLSGTVTVVGNAARTLPRDWRMLSAVEVVS